jgi:hypothetical protein
VRENFVVDLIRKIADEDMKVIASIFLVGLVGLVCPIDTDFLYEPLK